MIPELINNEDGFHPSEERKQRWKKIAVGMPPEALAAITQAPHARWHILTEDGPEIKREQRTASLVEPEEMPYWAFVLAKAYLDDVEEWPLFGMKAEMELEEYENNHHDPVLAVHEILSAVKPVWPEVSILYVGEMQ
ncbi:MAG: hypothetical protein HQL54_07710 [Magnetococcales bacterium]|nr:hypothetical protein [Magnetococcales bacterium]